MEYVIQKESKLKITHSCDVLVAGGGIAGISAALSAARQGVTVIPFGTGMDVGRFSHCRINHSIFAIMRWNG